MTLGELLTLHRDAVRNSGPMSEHMTGTQLALRQARADAIARECIDMARAVRAYGMTRLTLPQLAEDVAYRHYHRTRAREET